MNNVFTRNKGDENPVDGIFRHELWRDAWGRAIADAWRDPAKEERLLANPRAFLEEEYDFQLPIGLQVKVLTFLEMKAKNLAYDYWETKAKLNIFQQLLTAENLIEDFFGPLKNNTKSGLLEQFRKIFARKIMILSIEHFGDSDRDFKKIINQLRKESEEVAVGDLVMLLLNRHICKTPEQYNRFYDISVKYVNNLFSLFQEGDPIPQSSQQQIKKNQAKKMLQADNPTAVSESLFEYLVSSVEEQFHIKSFEDYLCWFEQQNEKTKPIPTLLKLITEACLEALGEFYEQEKIKPSAKNEDSSFKNINVMVAEEVKSLEAKNPDLIPTILKQLNEDKTQVLSYSTDQPHNGWTPIIDDLVGEMHMVLPPKPEVTVQAIALADYSATGKTYPFTTG
ncbi:MAG: hypothetical protein QM501_06590 [Gimesia sp.]